MSSQLTVSETIELLARLRETLRDCAATEEKLNRTFATSAAAAEKHFRAQIEAREKEVALELGRRQTQFEAVRQRFHELYQRRIARISKAHRSAKRKTQQSVNDEEGRRKYPLQRDVLETQRSRVEALKQNDNALASVRVQINDMREAFVSLEAAAHKVFRGYPGFRRRLHELPVTTDFAGLDESELLARLRQSHRSTATDLACYRKMFLPKVFRGFPLGWWFMLLLASVAIVPPLSRSLGAQALSVQQTMIGAAGSFALVLLAYFSGKVQARPLATAVAGAVNESRRMQDIAASKAESRHTQEKERVENATSSRIRQLEADWRAAEDEAAEARETLPRKIDEKSWRLSVKTDQLHQDKLERLDREYRDEVARLKCEAETWKQAFSASQATRLQELKATRDTGSEDVHLKRDDELRRLRAHLASATLTANDESPDWSAEAWKRWRPPASFATTAKLANVQIDLGNEVISAPLVLRCPNEASILFESHGPDDAAVFGALNGLILRFLATSPPGKASFTIFDPVKLGQNFAALMHLSDYGEGLMNGRIWTEAAQIEERLAELNAHMEKVIQNYIRNEYATIAEYNLHAGSIAERYHFLVIADLPTNFSEAAVRRLLRIAASGARCGVFTMIHWDRRHVSQHEALLEDLRKHSVCISNASGQWALTHPALPIAQLALAPAPPPQFATAFLHSVGGAHRGSTRVEVPFSVVAPRNSEFWSTTTSEELRVPIGRSGAAKAQALALGKGTRQHVLIAGKTGSGKSTLFHTIVTNLALWCSPHEVEFYLVDFKKGVEFKCYGTHRLPHARVVAIESDREFGLSVLQRVDEELRVRGELFRKSGVLDVAGYRAANPERTMPRCLLIIDEFQEFFVEDDRISQTANVLLDRIVRQGRAFGIHVLLGSQTLGGAYTLARTTLGQMVVRIALQCNEADAYLIMDESNSAPRLLSRPGEGIYNDSAGATEANSPFQAVWLPDDERDLWLKRVRKLADSQNFGTAEPIIFEGNAPADVRDNSLLRAAFESNTRPASTPRIWLGAPNSIKAATEAVFHRRGGSNLLVVGQQDEAAVTMVSLALIALQAQDPRAQCYVCGQQQDLGIPGAVFANPHDTIGILAELSRDLQHRSAASDSGSAPIFLFLHALQSFRKLRVEDEFAFSNDADHPAAQLRALIAEGPSLGIHVIVTIDSYSNVIRFLGRKALAEFEMRVLFQMSANDSASLCDDPRGSTLGMHRSLFYNEHAGQLETFRPYAPPAAEWIETARQLLVRRIEARGAERCAFPG